LTVLKILSTTDFLHPRTDVMDFMTIFGPIELSDFGLVFSI